ncbi:rhamnosyltransferase [Streptococcus sanguinis SK150]|jgi:lipopolysaccharide biosynthesis protein, putative|uniref:Rhamnosyltransferase n=1 Tax=Streptococcus sanguinis SK150 TaxID=888811 RepID=F0ILJ3_STRSA|nr:MULTISPECIES: rhamnan synthesis F family protein [Streptococcus]EGD36809.1 rhamnosyltransferase [Streptococcus sanguinis SK150]MBZ2056623.1 rhamnan synthesis F family protein [Streptococcus sanguinis]MDN5011389.1 lipopolysaccharide biosynthesis protein [Streptococcus sp. SN3]
MERILLYVHFNKCNHISGHVFYQLEQLKPLFSKILFISNSPLSDEDKCRLREDLGIADLLERDNQGFDFAAWRDGMNWLGFDTLQNSDSLTLMNDTCFGPLWDLAPIYQHFEEDLQVDFWGMTNFRKTRYFEEHLQSYFVIFKQSVLKDKAFREFWSQVEDFADVQDVIDHYETQFTKRFVEAGFRYQSLLDTRQEVARELLHPDFSYYKPLRILEAKVPFLKVKALTGNPFLARYLLEELETNSSYPTSLIREHLFYHFGPDLPCLLQDKYLSQSTSSYRTNQSVLLHIHVTNFPIFQQYQEKLFSLASQYQYLVTTNLPEMLKQLQTALAHLDDKVQIVLSQKSHALLAMLEQKEILQNYVYIGHLSTHRIMENQAVFDQAMRSDLINMMVDYADASIEALEQESAVGLVIPDLPRLVRDGLFESEPPLPSLTAVWQEAGLHKSFDFMTAPSLTRVYGGFLWFKYSALTSLFQMKSLESLPSSEQELSDVLEHLLVYIAWDSHYDFKIMPLSSLPSLLDLQRKREELTEQKEKLSQKNLSQKIRNRLSNLLKKK